jgi:CheY-like chemotaxis protein
MLTGKRIYVIEDDPTNMAIVVTLLKHYGALVMQDQYNSYSIDAVRRMLPIDLILLDLMLRRGVSGYDIFESLKTDAALAKIPAVIVSAADPVQEMSKAKALGFMGYIEKPIDSSTFGDTLLAILDGTPVWGEKLL